MAKWGRTKVIKVAWTKLGGILNCLWWRQK